MLRGFPREKTATAPPRAPPEAVAARKTSRAPPPHHPETEAGRGFMMLLAIRFALRSTIGTGGQGPFGRRRSECEPGNCVRTAANIAFAAGGHHVRINQGGHVTTTYHQRGFELRGRYSRRERIERLHWPSLLLPPAPLHPGAHTPL